MVLKHNAALSLKLRDVINIIVLVRKLVILSLTKEISEA